MKHPGVTIRIRMAAWGRLRTVFLLFAFLHPFLTKAGDYFPARFTPVSSNEGLSQGFVSCIIQDSRGFIWFATKDGLNKYDGYSFSVYRHDPENEFSLSENFILDIFEDSRGYLWLAMPHGVDVFDPLSETFSHVSFTMVQTNRPGIAADFTEDAQGNVWGRSPEGYYRFEAKERDTKSTRFSERYKIAATPLEKILRNETRAQLYCFERNGDAWVGRNDSLFFFTKESFAAGKPSAAYAQSAFSGVPGGEIRQIFPDTLRNELLLITSEGLVFYDKRSRQAGKIVLRKLGDFPNPKVTSIDEHGNVWMYFDGRLRVYKRSSGELQQVEPVNISREVFSSYNFRAALVDRSGMLWLGTNGFGAFKYNPRVAAFQLLDSRGVSLVNEDHAGNVYVSLMSDWYRFDTAARLLGERAFNAPLFRHTIGDRAGLLPRTFMQDAQHIFWLNYGEGVLARYDERANSIKFFRAEAPPSEWPNFASKTWFDKNGDPWISLECGPSNYICRFDRASERFDAPVKIPLVRDNFTYAYVSSVHIGANGDMWLGTIDGLMRFTPATGDWKIYRNVPGDKESLSSDIIFSLCPDPLQPERYLWAGTNSGGLNRFDLATGKFRRYTEKQGLPNNVIYGVLGDAQGHLWLSTNYGLCRFDVRTEACKNFFASDGLQGNEFNRYAYFKTSKGELYFGGVNGVSFFKPDALNNPERPPAVSFTGLRLFNRSVSFRDSGSVINKPVDFMEEIVLTYDQSVIAVEFAATDYAAPEKNQFKYMLEGFDKDWTFSGPRHEAIYTGLVPGEYRLVVLGANSEGVWSKTGRTLKIIVLPPWWQTWWARTLFALLAVGSVVGFFFARTASLRRSRKLLEEKVKERTRELNDSVLHLEQTQKQLIKNEKLASFGQLTAGIAHEIKNPLNFINNFSELGGEMLSELRNAETPEEREEILANLENFLQKISFHGNRVDSIIKSMLNHSRAGAQKQAMDINKMCEEFANLAYHSMRANVQDFSCALKKQLDPNLPQLYVIPQDISRVLLNLLNNAFYAVNERRKTAGHEYTPEVSITTRAENGIAQVIIRDNGSGIPPEVMEKLFDPFFTTKPSGEGTGLGLSISYDIVHSHGGRIQVESKQNVFTEFTISLPLTQ